MTYSPRSVAICLICFASVALADDFKTIDGKEYKNVTVTRVDADGINIKNTKAGVIAKLYFIELPRDVQERFGYDAEKATKEALARSWQKTEVTQPTTTSVIKTLSPITVRLKDEILSADGTGSAARFNQPGGVAVDTSGNVYVADAANHTIRKITSAGVVTTVAGLAGRPGSADGMGSAAQFNLPVGVAVDTSDNVYVADAGNHAIRKITSAGVVTTLAGSAGSEGRTIVGHGQPPFADGTGSAARFFQPRGVAVDTNGNVYVADEANQIVRKITPAGVVTTLAGSALKPGNADGTGSAARFNGPHGVAVDTNGNVYVSGSGNDTIRKITPGGVVATLAGSGKRGSADGTGSAAQFNCPYGVAVDTNGNVYVADGSNNTIRKITQNGDGSVTVSTLAGNQK